MKLRIKFRVIIMIIVLLAVTGCAAAITQRYTSSGKNIMVLRELYAKTPQKIKVGEFEGDKSVIGCRAESIAPPDRITFASFIRNALIEDLMLANVYADNADIEIRGKLVDIDLSCGIGTGEWVIEMEFTKFTTNGKETFTVKNSYDFEGAYMAITVVNNANMSLVPAIQEFIRAVISHPKFQSL